MICNHGNFSYTCNVNKFMAVCGLCDKQMLGFFNTVRCTDCSRYFHGSCAFNWNQYVEHCAHLIKTTGARVTERRTEEPEKFLVTKPKRSGLSAKSNRINVGTNKWNRVDGVVPSVRNSIRPSSMIPDHGSPILVTSDRESIPKTNTIYVGPQNFKPVLSGSAPVWNPIRVGPPLLIPINGGPIWITPVDPLKSEWTHF